MPLLRQELNSLQETLQTKSAKRQALEQNLEDKRKGFLNVTRILLKGEEPSPKDLQNTQNLIKELRPLLRPLPKAPSRPPPISFSDIVDELVKQFGGQTVPFRKVLAWLEERYGQKAIYVERRAAE